MAVLIALAACTSIPTERFDAYQQSFAQVKVSTEDMLLRARARTEAWANHPDNNVSASERAEKVREWLAALDDRQAALDTIDQYNTVLVRLAAGDDPAAIAGSLHSVADGLTSFTSSGLSKTIADTAPYFGVAAKLIAAIEDQAKRDEFARLVAEAQVPIAEIVRILSADAPDLEKILIKEPELERNMLTDQIDSFKFRFDDVAKKLTASDDVNALYTQHNQARMGLVHSKKEACHHTPEATAAKASASDIEVLKLIIDEESKVIAEANTLTERITGQARVTLAYQGALTAMNALFVAMNADLKQGRQQAALEFIRRGLEFRKAIIQVSKRAES